MPRRGCGNSGRLKELLNLRSERRQVLAQQVAADARRMGDHKAPVEIAERVGASAGREPLYDPRLRRREAFAVEPAG